MDTMQIAPVILSRRQTAAGAFGAAENARWLASSVRLAVRVARG